MDAAGYVTIVGRAKRFAKIGGEMVSMAAAEALAASLWPDAKHAVISLPDARKGEALMLVTTQQDADAARSLRRESADNSRDHGAARGAVRAIGAVAGYRQGRLSEVQRMAETARARGRGGSRSSLSCRAF